MPLVAKNFYDVVIFIYHEAIIPIEYSVINYRSFCSPGCGTFEPGTHKTSDLLQFKG